MPSLSFTKAEVDLQLLHPPKDFSLTFIHDLVLYHQTDLHFTLLLAHALLARHKQENKNLCSYVYIKLLMLYLI